MIGRGESERARALDCVGLGGNGGVDEVMRHWISSSAVSVYLGLDDFERNGSVNSGVGRVQ